MTKPKLKKTSRPKEIWKTNKVNRIGAQCMYVHFVMSKLDGIGPVDNTPSHRVASPLCKKKKKWEEVNLLEKFPFPSSYGLGVRGDM